MEKRIPLHVLQQGGGVSPIQAPLTSLGETAPMLLQAAGQPIDSGATAAARFSQISQQRVQHAWQRYAFEVQNDFREKALAMQEKGMDLEREKFEWRKLTYTEQQAWVKETWNKEYGMKERAMWNQEALLDIQILNSLNTETKTALGENGFTGAYMMAKTPAQVEALEAARAGTIEHTDALMQATKEKDRAGMSAARKAYSTSLNETMQPTLQAAAIVRESALYTEGNGSANETGYMEYNPYVFNMKYGELQKLPVDAPIDMLVPSIDKLIKQAVENNKDRWGFPQTVETFPGMLTTLQESPDMTYALKEYLQQDPQGSLRAEYDLRKANGDLRVADISFDDWVYDVVDAKVNALVPTTEYKVNNTNTSALDAQFDNDTDSDGNALYGVNGPDYGLGALTTQPFAAQRFDWEVTAGEHAAKQREIQEKLRGFGMDSPGMGRYMSARLTEKMGGEPDYGDLSEVFTDPNLSDGIRRTVSVRDIEENNKLMETGASLYDGIAFSDYDPDEYFNEDRTLTDKGLLVSKKLQTIDEEVMRHAPLTRGLSNDTKKEMETALNLGRSRTVGDLISSNRFVAGSDAPMVMELTGGKYKGIMYSADELRALFPKTKETKVTVSSIVDKENIIPLYAMLHRRGGELDPWRWGVNPIVLKIEDTSEDQSTTRHFILPRDREFISDRPEMRAMNQLYVRALMGGGEQLRPTNNPEATKQLVGSLMSQYAGELPAEQFQKEVEAISQAFTAVEMTGESTFTKGPHANAIEGDVMMVFDYEKTGGGAGSVTVEDVANAPEAMRLASNLGQLLSPEDTYEIHSFANKGQAPTYAVSINGELHPEMIDGERAERDLMMDIKYPAYNLQPNDPSKPLGAYGNLQAMGGVKDETVQLKFSEAFMDSETGVGALDQKLIDYNEERGKDLSYIVTSGYRPGPGEHGKYRAMDWRNDRHLVDFFVNVTEGDFRPTPRGRQAMWYDIPGTLLRVALHDNRDDPSHGQHFDLRLRIGALGE